jgi:hypothetical protein
VKMSKLSVDSHPYWCFPSLALFFSQIRLPVFGTESVWTLGRASTRDKEPWTPGAGGGREGGREGEREGGGERKQGLE